MYFPVSDPTQNIPRTGPTGWVDIVGGLFIVGYVIVGHSQSGLTKHDY